MKVINLFAAPGTGKSTTAAGLFFLMKHAGFKVELVTEYAKQMVWDERHNIFTDQLYITAKQNRCLERLRGKVDYAITDSPLLLALIYKPDSYYPSFLNLLKELWFSYDNMNFLLHRVKPYHKLGRNQTEAESDDIQKKLALMLTMSMLHYVDVPADRNAPQIIFDTIKQNSVI